jgi:hypothetical protein
LASESLVTLNGVAVMFGFIAFASRTRQLTRREAVSVSQRTWTDRV